MLDDEVPYVLVVKYISKLHKRFEWTFNEESMLLSICAMFQKRWLIKM